MEKTTIKQCPINLSGIYKLDFPNGKSYIGKAVDIKRRMCEHCTDKKQPVLYAAIHKYFNGKINTFIILEKNVPRELLSEREQYYIALYGTNNKERGYNLTSGGDGAALGIENVASKFTQEDLNNIIKLLQETEIPMYQIAEIYKCNRVTIERLNSGETYFDQNLVYPIRQKKYIPKSGVENSNSSLNQQQLDQLIEDLKNTNISYADISLKYNIGQTTLTKINTGKSYYNPNLEYPIRRKNANRLRIFTQEEMDLIKNMLLQDKKKVPMSLIGEALNCDRKVISEINKGTRQKIDNWTYPIRK